MPQDASHALCPPAPLSLLGIQGCIRNVMFKKKIFLLFQKSKPTFKLGRLADKIPQYKYQTKIPASN